MATILNPVVNGILLVSDALRKYAVTEITKHSDASHLNFVPFPWFRLTQASWIFIPTFDYDDGVVLACRWREDFFRKSTPNLIPEKEKVCENA